MITTAAAPNTAGAKAKGNLPTYTMPKPPGPTDTTLSLTGTFADQATAADTAYNNALAQLAAQKSQYYSNAGFNQDGTIANDPLSQYGMMTNQLAQNSNATDRAIMARGLGQGRNVHGVGAQLTEATNEANAATQHNFLSNFMAGADNLTNQGTAAEQAHTDQLNAARQGMINYLIQNGQHITANGSITQQEANQRIAALRTQWMKSFGKGANSTNKTGKTFEQWLSHQDFWNPSAKYGIGSVRY